jgi:hypothetical protein
MTKTDPNAFTHQLPTERPHPIIATSVTSLDTSTAIMVMVSVNTRLIPILIAIDQGMSFLFHESPLTACGTEKKLTKLSMSIPNSANDSLKVFIQQAVPEKEPIPGAVIAVQTFGDFLGFNPHCHILLTDGCFLRQAQDNVYGERGMFRVAPPLELKKLESIFRHKVFKMLMKKGKITEKMIRMLSAWKHSGFNIFCCNRPSTSSGQA